MNDQHEARREHIMSKVDENREKPTYTIHFKYDVDASSIDEAIETYRHKVLGYRMAVPEHSAHALIVNNVTGETENVNLNSKERLLKSRMKEGETYTKIWPIFDRIRPDAYMGSMLLPDSDPWIDHIVELNHKLAAIDPDYQIHQLKEKFSLLRMYIASESPRVDEMRKIINTYEDDSKNWD